MSSRSGRRPIARRMSKIVSYVIFPDRMNSSTITRPEPIVGNKLMGSYVACSRPVWNSVRAVSMAVAFSQSCCVACVELRYEIMTWKRLKISSADDMLVEKGQSVGPALSQ